LVSVNTGLPTAVGFPAVLVVPPPHWVLQPLVVGVTVTRLLTDPAEFTTPVTVSVVEAPGSRLTVPETSLPVALQVLGALVLHATDPTVLGTVSATVAVPVPVPVFLTVIVYVIGWPTM